MDNPWIIHRLSMDYPWIICGYPWIIQRYQGILFVTKWHAVQAERISTRPISMIFRRASSRISKCPGVHFLFLGNYVIPYLFWEHPGGPKEHPGTTVDQFGGGWGLQGPCLMIFLKSRYHEKSTFACFPWPFLTKLGAIDAESMPGHFPAIGLQKKTGFPCKQK